MWLKLIFVMICVCLICVENSIRYLLLVLCWYMSELWVFNCSFGWWLEVFWFVIIWKFSKCMWDYWWWLWVIILFIFVIVISCFLILSFLLLMIMDFGLIFIMSRFSLWCDLILFLLEVGFMENFICGLSIYDKFVVWRMC